MRLDKNMRTWVEDRIDHSDPLYYNEFAEFMNRLGFGDKYKGSKKHKAAMKKAYEKEKKRQQRMKRR